MSLLKALNLPVPPHLAFRQTRALTPVAGIPASTAQSNAQSNSAAAIASTAGAVAGLRIKADQMRVALEAARQQKAALLLRLQQAEIHLAAMATTEAGAARAEIATKQALIAKKRPEVERELQEIEADLTVIDTGGSSREALIAVLARRRAAVAVAAATDTSEMGPDSLHQSRLKQGITSTRSAYADGKATVETRQETSRIDTHGLTATESQENQVRSAELNVRASHDKSTNVSLGGKVSNDESAKVEVELSDGKKSSHEQSTATEFSSDGTSRTHTNKQTLFDGSSSLTTTSKGVERGEGKVNLTSSSSVTHTSASGVARTAEAKMSAGLVAGKDGFGSSGSLEAGKKITSRGGEQAGFVAGLHANVVCNVGEGSGDPPMYAVTLTVSFGASAALSSALGQRDGANSSANGELKSAAEQSMVITHLLAEKELGLYKKALEAASKGSQLAGTGREFLIMATGVREGWRAARALYVSGGKIDKTVADTLKSAGDFVKTTESTNHGKAGKASIGGVGIGYGSSVGATKALQIKRNAQGGLDADSASEQRHETKVSGSLGMGSVSLGVGRTTTHKTGFGVSITINPGIDSDVKILEAYGKCSTQQEFEAFLAKYRKHGVAVSGKSEETADAVSLETGVSIGRMAASLSDGHGTDKKSMTDADGKVSRTFGGHGSIGGKLGGRADSKDDDALAEIDADGTAQLSLTSTVNDNHNDRSRDKRKKKFLEQISGKSALPGALTRLANGEEDAFATHDLSGLKLNNEELRRLGGVACRSLSAWVGIHRRADEVEDLKRAGLAIVKAKGDPAVVAEQLAKFIGGDSIERLETIQRVVRGGMHMGSAFEFPDSIRSVQVDYESVTDRSFETRINKIGAASRVKAKDECQRLLKLVDPVMHAITTCDDFSDKAVRAEMLQRLESARENLSRASRFFSGQTLDADAKEQARVGERLVKQCGLFYVDEEQLQSKLRELKGNAATFDVGDRREARHLVTQLEELHGRWWTQWSLLSENYKARGLSQHILECESLMPRRSVVDDWNRACGD